MKTKMITVLLIITVLLSLVLFLWLYLFNIYEVKVVVSPEYVLINDKSKVEISVIPLNSFGGKALFRKVKAKFNIEKGKELINNFTVNDDSNKMILELKNTKGKILISVEADYGLFPTLVEIPILESSVHNID